MITIFSDDALIWHTHMRADMADPFQEDTFL